MIADFLAATDPVEVFRRAFNLEPHAAQLSYLREQRNTDVLKGRQTGFSTAASGLAIHQARYQANTNAVIVSPTLKQSTEITTRSRAGLRALGVTLLQDSSSVIRLANGSRILSLPGTARSVRGWSAALLIIDEAAFVEEATWTAARALVATGGRLVVQSTPAGEYGSFFELVKANAPEWAHFVVRSDEVPTISAEFLAQERRAMTPDAYATEYECQFGRAGATLFTADRIASLILPEEAAS
jgi:hypothetical protein